MTLMVTLSPETRAIADAQAARDRDLLARFLREGRLRRDKAVGAEVAGARAFTRDIERRAWPPRAINLGIRPSKTKKGKKR